MSSIFGPIFDGSILSQGVIATLKTWMPTYLEEIEVQRGIIRKTTPPPSAYFERNEFIAFLDDIPPFVIVACGGTTGEPAADGEGRYRAWWNVGVGVVAAANNEENTERLAKMYGAAVRTVMLQKQGLDDSWDYGGVEWDAESYDEVPNPTQEGSLRAALLTFRVLVNDITTRFAGPAYPAIPDPIYPGSDWPEVATAEAIINRIKEE